MKSLGLRSGAPKVFCIDRKETMQDPFKAKRAKPTPAEIAPSDTVITALDTIDSWLQNGGGYAETDVDEIEEYAEILFLFS